MYLYVYQLFSVTFSGPLCQPKACRPLLLGWLPGKLQGVPSTEYRAGYQHRFFNFRLYIENRPHNPQKRPFRGKRKRPGLVSSRAWGRASALAYGILERVNGLKSDLGPLLHVSGNSRRCKPELPGYLGLCTACPQACPDSVKGLLGKPAPALLLRWLLGALQGLALRYCLGPVLCHACTSNFAGNGRSFRAPACSLLPDSHACDIVALPSSCVYLYAARHEIDLWPSCVPRLGAFLLCHARAKPSLGKDRALVPGLFYRVQTLPAPWYLPLASCAFFIESIFRAAGKSVAPWFPFFIASKKPRGAYRACELVLRLAVCVSLSMPSRARYVANMGQH